MIDLARYLTCPIYLLYRGVPFFIYGVEVQKAVLTITVLRLVSTFSLQINVAEMIEVVIFVMIGRLFILASGSACRTASQK